MHRKYINIKIHKYKFAETKDKDINKSIWKTIYKRKLFIYNRQEKIEREIVWYTKSQ